MTKLIKGLIIGGGSVVAVATGAGIATGVILPKTLELKDGLLNFVPNKGDANWSDWSTATKKLNYVALGDSETAGFNGFMHDETADSGGTGVTMGSHLSQANARLRGGDYLSYADFLANDLKKVDKLGSYHNFAESGATIADQQQMFLENTQIHETLKKADLITITIGANDLLSFIKILDLPFDSNIFQLIQDSITGVVKPAAAANAVRDAIRAGDSQPTKINEGVSSDDVKDLALSSIDKLVEMAKTKDYSHIIDIARDFKDVIFDALYRNLMVFIHDLHTNEVAPNAQIVVLGHAMPFEQWPPKVLEAKREDLGGKSIRSMFDQLLDSMNRAANFNDLGDTDYSGFLSVDELQVKKAFDTDQHATDAGSHQTGSFVDFVKRDPTDTKFYTANAMPNAGDIHPSTFGHQLIGNAVFDYLYPHLGKTTTSAIDNYTFSTRYVAGAEDHFLDNAKTFMAFDEKPDLDHSTADTLKGLLSGGGGFNLMLSAAGDPLRAILATPSGANILKPLLGLMSGGQIDAATITAIKSTGTKIATEVDSLDATKFPVEIQTRAKALLGFLDGMITTLTTGDAIDKTALAFILGPLTGAGLPDTDGIATDTQGTVEKIKNESDLVHSFAFPTTDADVEASSKRFYETFKNLVIAFGETPTTAEADIITAMKANVAAKTATYNANVTGIKGIFTTAGVTIDADLEGTISYVATAAAKYHTEIIGAAMNMLAPLMPLLGPLLQS